MTKTCQMLLPAIGSISLQIATFILLFVGICLHLFRDYYSDIPSTEYTKGGFDDFFAGFSRMFALITAENFQDLFVCVGEG